MRSLTRSSVVLVVALAAAMVTPTAAQAAATVPPVFPIVSSPAVKVVAPTEPAGKFSPAVDGVLRPTVSATKVTTLPTGKEVKSAPFDMSSATLVASDEFSDTYRDVHGTRRLVQSPSPLNVKSAGRWVPISTALGDAGAGGLQAKLSPLAPRFASRANTESPFQVSNNGFTVSVSLDGAAGSSLSHPTVPFTDLGADQAGYFSVLPNTDLRYQVHPQLVSQSLVINKVPAAGKGVYSWTVTAPGLTLSKTAAGDLSFVNSAGVTEFTMPAPVITDSSSKETQPTLVPYSVARVAGSVWSLTLTPPRGWLTDAAREYPVVIHPDIALAIGTSNAFSLSGAGTAVWGGQIGWDGRTHWVAMQQYDYSPLFGSQLTGASIGIDTVSPNAPWCLGMGGNVYLADGVKYDLGGDDAMSIGMGCSGSTAVSSDPELNYDFAAYVAAQNPNALIKINWINPSTGASLSPIKHIDSTISLDYRPLPSVTGITGTIASNGAVGPLQPTIQATGSDPIGATLNYEYEFSSTPDFSTIAYTTGWVGPDMQTIRYGSGGLLPGTKYYYRVGSVEAGNPLTWNQSTYKMNTNPAWSFTTNTPAPTPPQASAIPGDGTVVSSLTPMFSSPTVTDPAATQPLQYKFRV
ncbi:MAG: hypothetical protein V4479_07730, partial [Actinomycetota bacterium]